MDAEPAHSVRVFPILGLCAVCLSWLVAAVATRKRAKEYGPAERRHLRIWRAMYPPMMLLILVSAIANSCVPDGTAILLGGLECIAACAWLGVLIFLLPGPWGTWLAGEMKGRTYAWLSPKKYVYVLVIGAAGLLVQLLRAATYLLSVWLALD